MNILEPPLKNICDKIINEILVPNMNPINNCIEDLSEMFTGEIEAFKTIINRIMMDYCFSRLVDKKIITDFPLKVALNWGYWAWIGESDILSPKF